MPQILAIAGKAAAMFFARLLLATLTEKVLAKVTFYALEKLASKTENKLDDEMVKDLKNTYYQVPDSEVKQIVK